MIIYVEYILIDNMVIDVLILLLTKSMLKINTKKIFIFLSAFLGTIIALISPLLSSTINIIIKIPLSICMVMICYHPKTLKQFFAELLGFYIATFVLIGACLGICEMLGIKYIISNGISYEYNFPVGFVLVVCTMMFVGIKNIIKLVSIIHKNDKYIYQITLIENDKSIEISAFLDTGNKLIFNNKPISIINYKTFEKLYPSILLMDILLKKQLPLKNSTYFEIKSLGNPQKILIFEIEKIVIDKREINNPLVGLSLENFQKQTHSDMIISSNLLGE